MPDNPNQDFELLQLFEHIRSQPDRQFRLDDPLFDGKTLEQFESQIIKLCNVYHALNQVQGWDEHGAYFTYTVNPNYSEFFLRGRRQIPENN